MGKKWRASRFTIQIEIVKDIPTEKIQKYADLVVENVANEVLDYTLADNRFPYKTGNLQRSSMAHRPRKEKYCVYCLDVPPEADYTRYVWGMKNVNWTNPDTYQRWFSTLYKEKKQLINKQASESALRSVK